MKKTFTLLFAIIILSAYSQRATKQIQFSNVNPILDKKFMPTLYEKQTNNNVVWGEYFDTIGSGTNGLPANFSYTPNSANIADQWQWSSDANGGRIGKEWYANMAISETFYTDAHTVPSTNPALYVVFANSYYWSIDQGTDSLEISYSIDGGNNWVRLWSNRDQALVEASGIGWPYPSDWVPLIARIALPQSTIGYDMEFKFMYQGGTANGIYVYSIEMLEEPNYEVEMQNYIAENIITLNDTNYFDGIYQLLPLNQKRNFEYFRASVKNYGHMPATNMAFSNTLKSQSGTIIAQKDTNFMTTGATNLTNYLDIDEFQCNLGFDNIDAVTVGQYVLESSISYDSIAHDGIPANNSWSIGIEYDQPVLYNFGNPSHLARNTTVDGELSVENYSGGAENDMLGMSFYVTDCFTSYGAKIPLGPSTTDNTGFQARIYAWDSGAENWTEVAYADDYYASAADAGTTISVDFVNAIALYPDTAYMLVCAAKFTSGTSSIYFSTYNGYKDYESTSYLNRYASALNIGGTWYYINSVPTMVLELEPCFTGNEILATEEIKVYPNPTKGLFNIDNAEGANIKVFNMLGDVVEEIDNSNKFNTINLSNYENGTYLVKVFTKEGVFVEKLYLLK